MKLIVMSTSHLFIEEGDVINALFEAGMDIFHLRKPGASIPALRTLIEQIDPAYRNMLVLHQHHALCDEFELPRRHYPEQLRQHHAASGFADLQQRGLKLSTSIHELDSISAYSAFEYVFFSPVFDSISKAGYHSKLPTNFRLERKSGWPAVIALGGIEARHVEQVSAMNFDGLAVLGAIWNIGQSPVENFLALHRACLLIKNSETN
jgi:thiamine-phosphate pyrophosphorylase